MHLKLVMHLPRNVVHSGAKLNLLSLFTMNIIIENENYQTFNENGRDKK